MLKYGRNLEGTTPRAVAVSLQITNSIYLPERRMDMLAVQLPKFMSVQLDEDTMFQLRFWAAMHNMTRHRLVKEILREWVDAQVGRHRPAAHTA